jgi:hypothetical protein
MCVILWNCNKVDAYVILYDIIILYYVVYLSIHVHKKIRIRQVCLYYQTVLN